MNKIGELIVEYRKKHNITQKELADMLGVSNTAVSKWECGNNLPDISMLKPLSEILNVSVLTLIDCEEDISMVSNDSVNTKRFKKYKLIISILLLTIIFNIVLICIYKKDAEDCDVIASNGKNMAVYNIYSNDSNLQINGYLMTDYNSFNTVINKINFSATNRGTNKEVKAKNVELRIVSNNDILYFYGCETDAFKSVDINDLFNDVLSLMYEIKVTNYEYYINNDKFDANLILEFSNDSKNYDELSFPITFERLVLE